ncbi:MAG: serine/threonine protein kinase [Planctomycetes bacterium]|nr:serine/threonine protein kinase [Planctomycetota bacterium]
MGREEIARQEQLIAVAAVRSGLISREQLEAAAIEAQKAARGAEGPASLLKLLVKNGLLTDGQVESLKQALETASHRRAAAERGEKNLKTGLEVDDVLDIPGFDVREKVGAGGMGAVFAADDRESGRRVALKVMYPAHARNELFVERWQREARLLVEFDCPSIVKGIRHGSYEDDDVGTLHWMAMEFIEGGSVQDILNREGRLSEEFALFVIKGCAEALDYCLSHGILHRDIKPDNIMLTTEGAIVLCDLGFAKPIEAHRAGERETTTCGTVQYISPEQARGYADVDIRADIYSLGATLYHLVVGSTPFAGSDAAEVMAKQVRDSLDSQEFHDAGVSQHVRYFIERMMAKERDIRFETPRELLDCIDTIVEGIRTMEFRPDPPRSPLEPPPLPGGGAGAHGKPSRNSSSSARRSPAKKRSATGTITPPGRAKKNRPPAPTDRPAPSDDPDGDASPGDGRPRRRG